MPDLYSDWERWAADVAESHTTYPVLLLFRSPEPWYSWAVGLLAVLDAAAMDLALSPDASSSQARLCLRMGFTTFNRIAKTLGWPVDPDPSPEGPITLTFEEFEQAVHMLQEIGYPMELTRRRGVAELPGLAGELRDQRLPVGRPCGRSPRAVVGTTEPSASGPVAPRRPPQRSPGAKVVGRHRPDAEAAPPRRRGSLTRRKNSN